MRSLRSLVALAAVAAVLVAGLALTGQDRGERPGEGRPVFPDLLDRLDAARVIDVKARGEAFRLTREGERWVVRERGGYPASATKVRGLLLGLAELVRIEAKTRRPEHYAKLGLGDPGDAASASVRYTVSGEGDQVLADLLVGNRRFAKGEPDASEFFVREPGDPETWLAQGRLPTGRSVTEWMDKVIARIERKRVARVRVTHPDGAVVEVTHPDPEAADYRLENVPEGRQVDGQWNVNDIGRFFEDLQLEDVRAAEAWPDGAEPERRVEMTTVDGLRVELDTLKDGEKVLARLVASGGEGAEAAAAEAETLNARWRGRVYVLPGFKAGYLAKGLEDMLEAPPGEGEPSPGQS